MKLLMVSTACISTDSLATSIQSFKDDYLRFQVGVLGPPFTVFDPCSAGGFTSRRKCFRDPQSLFLNTISPEALQLSSPPEFGSLQIWFPRWVRVFMDWWEDPTQSCADVLGR